MKYYLKRNAGKPLELSKDVTLRFTPCEQVANTWIGVYATKDEAEIKLLKPLVEKKLVLEVDKPTYERRLRSRLKERVEAQGTGTNPSNYQPHPDKSDTAKPAEVESVSDVTEEQMNATGAKEAAKSGQAYISKLGDLAIELGIGEDELADLRKREGCPDRTGKGYHVKSFLEFMANISKPDEPTD